MKDYESMTYQELFAAKYRAKDAANLRAMTAEDSADAYAVNELEAEADYIDGLMRPMETWRKTEQASR